MDFDAHDILAELYKVADFSSRSASVRGELSPIRTADLASVIYVIIVLRCLLCF